MYCGKQWCQQIRHCRAGSGFISMKGRLLHQEHISKTSNESSIKKFGNRQYYLAEKIYEGEKEHRQRFSHSNQMGILFGIVGTAAALGIGSALCESQEENISDSTLPLKSKETSTKHDVTSEQILNIQDIYPAGDVVGTYRNIHQNEKSSRRSITNVQNVSESSSTQATYNSSERKKLSVQDAAERSQQLLKRLMEEVGAPGLVVAVSVDGATVWADGFGYADVENSVQCSPNTVMRIASISKPITMTAVAKLWEEGKLDLDAPIQKYIPSFPVKTYDGEEVTITTRHLISHQSGIRHYRLKGQSKVEKEDDKEKFCCRKKEKHDREKLIKKEKEEDNKEKAKLTEISQQKAEDKKEMIELAEVSKQEDEDMKTDGRQSENEKDSNISKNEEIKIENEKESSENKETRNEKSSCIHTMVGQKRRELNRIIKAKTNKKRKAKKKEEEENEFDLQEYHIKEEFDTIQEALELFQNDELFFKPGSDFLYTTHGWTVVSGVVEGAAKKPFTRVISRLFYDMGLHNTYLDKNSPIIYDRARYYIRDRHGKLKNAPYVDNSYKWAGGGFLSTVLDLTKFGNALLYASQQEIEMGKEGSNRLPGFLKASTMRDLWTPGKGTSINWIRDEAYGMGWTAAEKKTSYGFCRNSKHYASHTGGAVGASSVLLILPKQVSSNKDSGNPPKGITVTIMTNMQGVGLSSVALQIADLFENVQQSL